MIAAIADTHTAIWYVNDDPRLSRRAGAIMDSVRTERHEIGLSSITLVEIVYLQEKGRIAPGALAGIHALLDDVNPLLIELPVNRAIAAVLARIDRRRIPDMPDRIIAATALSLDVPVISRDGRITTSGITTIW